MFEVFMRAMFVQALQIHFCIQKFKSGSVLVIHKHSIPVFPSHK